MKTALLFNGAAAYIAQEAAMVDLLLGNVDGVEGKLSSINQREVFTAGLSSGSLMTFAVNIAFSDNPPLPWEDFKNNVLFPLTTEQVFKASGETPYDTSPLRELLSGISTNVGYKVLSELPFETAILVASSASPRFLTCWLTAIPEIASQLPGGLENVYKNLRRHQPNIDLVDALMSSAAVPVIFPQQSLKYHEDGQSDFIRNIIGKPALFADGGSRGFFKRFDEFFDIYKDINGKFDEIYLISPDYPEESSTYRSYLTDSSRSGGTDYLLDQWTREFLRDLRDYNEENNLADNIYHSSPEIPEGKYDSLDFSREQEQYEESILWGKANPDLIAVNINDLDL